MILWQQSMIINHLYWSVMSTPAGDGQLIVAKWKILQFTVPLSIYTCYMGTIDVGTI